MALFLDANAHLPINQKALQAYVDFNNSTAGHGHPMASSVPGRAAAKSLEDARAKIASLIGTQAPHIIFTSTCTQACEWGLELLKNQKFDKVYTSVIEHKSVAVKARELFGNNDLYAGKNGITSIFKPVEKNAAFVCMHVQNEIGTIQPIDKISIPFFCDLSQSIGKIPVNVSSFPNMKLATFGAHKFGGPGGLGVLYIQDLNWWKAFGTGSRYFFDRTGTPDVAAAVSASVALEEAIKTLDVRYENALRFNGILENALWHSGYEVIGSSVSRIPHTSFINVGNKLAPYLMEQLSSEGIYVGLGSACGSVNVNNNPVMTAIGYPGKAQDYMRISQWGEYGEKEANILVKALLKYFVKN